MVAELRPRPNSSSVGFRVSQRWPGLDAHPPLPSVGNRLANVPASSSGSQPRAEGPRHSGRVSTGEVGRTSVDTPASFAELFEARGQGRSALGPFFARQN